MFNLNKPRVLEIDILDFAIGIYLSQEGDNRKLRPIIYHLRKLSALELNYNIYNKELLAIVIAY